MIEILGFTLLGICIGCITGIIPGMHLNNFLPALIGLVPLIGIENTCYLIISIAISQNFFSFFSSTFLGAPTESTALNVLPAHRLLMKGKALNAIFYQATGAFFASLLSFLFVFVCFPFFKEFYSATRPFIPWILILVTILMILSEKGFRKFLSFFITLLSATLGFITLNLLLVKNTIFPLLSGFFGVPTLLISLKNQAKIPKQKLNIETSLNKKHLFLASFFGSLSGMLAGLLPAIGVSQFAYLFTFHNPSPEFFLSVSGGINLANEVFSLFSLFLIGNPRSGASVAIEKILNDLTFNHFLIFLNVILISLTISYFLLLSLSKFFTNFISKLNYKILNLLALLIISLSTLYFVGLIGILILITSTSIGLLTNFFKIKRTHCMSSLIIPTTTFFLGLNPLILKFL